MYIARFFQGFGAALLLITVDTITSDLVPADQRARMMGGNIEIQTRASVVGATIGFTLIGFMPAVAWPYSFSFFAAMALLAFIYAVVKLPETRPTQSTAIPPPFRLSPQLKRAFALFVFLGAAAALILPMYLVYLQDTYTLDPRMLSWAFLPAALLSMFLPSRLGAFVDKRNPRIWLIAAMATAGCLYLLMPLATGFWWMVLLYSLSCIAWSLIEPTRKSLTAGLADPTSLARTFGLAEMAFGAGAICGPLIGGYLYDNVSHTSPFIFNGILILAAALLAIGLLDIWPRKPGQI
jgi:predicted MFS family arabinose efflux permease